MSESFYYLRLTRQRYIVIKYASKHNKCNNEQENKNDQKQIIFLYM